MDVIRRKDAIFVDKGTGTLVHYYIQSEYEIHYNEVLPETIQEWHHHDKIEEVLYIIDGQLTAHWRDDGGAHQDDVGAGDLVRVGRVPHTFTNETDTVVRFVVFRMVPDGNDKRELIKSDKVLD